MDNFRGQENLTKKFHLWKTLISPMIQARELMSWEIKMRTNCSNKLQCLHVPQQYSKTFRVFHWIMILNSSLDALHNLSGSTNSTYSHES